MENQSQTIFEIDGEHVSINELINAFIFADRNFDETKFSLKICMVIQCFLNHC